MNLRKTIIYDENLKEQELKVIDKAQRLYDEAMECGNEIGYEQQLLREKGTIDSGLFDEVEVTYLREFACLTKQGEEGMYYHIVTDPKDPREKPEEIIKSISRDPLNRDNCISLDLGWLAANPVKGLKYILDGNFVSEKHFDQGIALKKEQLKKSEDYIVRDLRSLGKNILEYPGGNYRGSHEGHLFKIV